ncbi:MAG: UDP-glucose 4-epimerase GalE [Bacteroidota bacterium]
MKQRILVTGGTGYIGSHTVVELQEQGFDVVIIDDLSNSSIEVLDNIRQITGTKPGFEKFDLCDNDKLSDFFTKYDNISSIIHFAAYKSVGESVRSPLKYYRNNLLSLINLLSAMEKNNIANIVFSSSCTVYGEPDELPVTEETPLKPAISPYGNTKRICEEIIRDRCCQVFPPDNISLINAISLRYFNPIGAHHSALIGEVPSGTSDNLIPPITQTAIGKRKSLNVYGNDYDTPDGSCIRDYIHIVDVAKAHIVAIKRLNNKQNKTSYEVFNLGTGKGNSVFEVIDAFEKVSGIKLNYIIVDKRPGDITNVYADTSYANKELGWKAERTLEEMVLSAWEWEKAL